MNRGGRLLLPAAAREAIRRHAEAAWPEECCGILVGRFAEGAAGGATAEVVEAVAAANVHADRRRRYAIAPEALLAAQQGARSAGLDLVGYYHSHPDRPAEPSAHDRRDAWPGVSYLIVAVGAGVDGAGGGGGAAGELRSWRLDAAAGAFVEQAVEIAGGGGARGAPSRPPGLATL